MSEKSLNAKKGVDALIAACNKCVVSEIIAEALLGR